MNSAVIPARLRALCRPIIAAFFLRSRKNLEIAFSFSISADSEFPAVLDEAIERGDQVLAIASAISRTFRENQKRSGSYREIRWHRVRPVFRLFRIEDGVGEGGGKHVRI